MQLLIIIANRTPSISGTQRALTCSSLRKNVIYVLWYSLESQKIPFMLLVEMQFIANYLCDTPTSHSRNVVHTYHQGTWQIRPSFLKSNAAQWGSFEFGTKWVLLWKVSFGWRHDVSCRGGCPCDINLGARLLGKLL